MKNLAVWKLLDGDHPAMLLYVLHSNGSSPGRQGFCMAVNNMGEMEGSIGGGIMEHKFVEVARQKLAEQAACSIIKKQVHDKSAGVDQSGMICSGEQTIFIYSVRETDTPHIKGIIDALEHSKPGTLLLSTKGIEFSPSVSTLQYEYRAGNDTSWLYKEKLGPVHSLHIIGGGHCSLALSRLMAQLDFQITVYDDRQNLKTLNENDSAHRKTIISGYPDLQSLIPEGTDQYIVIATFGYRTDDLALRALLNKNVKYLGVLGSRSKIEKMLQGYRQEGIPEELLTRLYAPIGYDINSQTPAEIAVSIAAQIIAVKNKAFLTNPS